MADKRTFIDADLLIAAANGSSAISEAALSVLDDPGRRFVTSDALRLEVLPKPVFFKRGVEVDFLNAVFEMAEHQPWSLHTLSMALDFANRYGLGAMDAIHIATAVAAQVDEFVTGEQPTKPMFQVKELNVKSVRTGL